MSPRPIVVWFRQDLRLADNIALTKAVETGRPIVALYVYDETSQQQWAPGGASRWWLHHSLTSLHGDLASLGARLILRRGPQAQTVAEFVNEIDAAGVYFSRQYEPWAAGVEAQVNEALTANDTIDVKIRRFSGSLLREPEDLRTKQGGPYKVYTPFWRALNELGQPRKPLQRPKRLVPHTKKIKSDKLTDWSLLPTRPDWAGGLKEMWSPGEAGALARLDEFLDSALRDYADHRNRPDLDGTSRLSPHLHFGEISPAAVWHTTRSWAAANGYEGKGLEVFLKELVWREFSIHLLHHFPQLPTNPLRPEFARFPWSDDEQALRAWQRGRTGYPIVDAGMRQLWHTGWMHNRVRMIVASFLIKDLFIHWREGETWFWDTLVDADLASNAASWQWVAGSGADAAPYFRVFNPVTQGQKFDAGGDYVRQWVPEIAALPDRFVHAPWTAPPLELTAAGIELGTTYPHPIVDHAQARNRALDEYKKLKD
ncbi:MAG: DNA photolyase family protein [Alphaproteobacteria bacterium]|nr:DNA photolyase family protein [Alphaproteobacteria bacterium]